MEMGGSWSSGSGRQALGSGWKLELTTFELLESHGSGPLFSLWLATASSWLVAHGSRSWLVSHLGIPFVPFVPFVLTARPFLSAIC